VNTTAYALIAVVAVLASLGVGVCVVMQPFVIPVRSTPAPVDAAKLEAHVRMLAHTFYPRSFDQPDKLEAAASYVHAEMEKAGARVENQYFVFEESRYRNVVGRYGPDDAETIVIGAHYDSYADAQEGAKFKKGFDSSTHTPGADDNASGVAGLLELARLLGQTAPDIGVELVAYALEEPPSFGTDTMGSVHHARRLRDSKRRVALMISLEMIGHFDTRPGSQSYPLPGMQLLYPDTGDFIGVVGRIADWAATRKVKAAMLGGSDLAVRSMNAMTIVRGVDFSDHRSYWNEGMSAVMITDTAFYRNPQYHQAGDTADRLDYARMAQVVQGVFALIKSYRER
jgi:Zn-dependent M28 family amino/carboxypeptidase